MNSYTWFTDLEQNEQKDLCLKYSIDCHNVSLNDMDKMYAGEVDTFIPIYFNVNPQPYGIKTISVYLIQNNIPKLLLRFNLNKIENDLDGIKRLLKHNKFTPEKYLINKLP